MTTVATGVWLGASYVLDRPVPVSEPYPHICGNNVQGRMSSRRVVVWIRDCAACVQDEHDEQEQPDQLPSVDPEISAAERRRLGEKD